MVESALIFFSLKNEYTHTYTKVKSLPQNRAIKDRILNKKNQFLESKQVIQKQIDNDKI